MTISGKCDPKFERVREEFERNFQEREEVGASVCVTLDGETVVDLWGGTADVDTGEPWKEDTTFSEISRKAAKAAKKEIKKKLCVLAALREILLF